MKIISSLKVLSFFAISFLVIKSAQAMNTANIKNTATGTGLTETNIFNISTTALSLGLSFLGVIFLVLALAAGFIWMTSQGEKAKVKKAKDILKMATLGLIVVFAAFAISAWVGDTFSTPTIEQNQ